MKYSLSFLATDFRQMPQIGRYGNTAVEAVVFQEEDLIGTAWQLTWENIKKATKAYGAENVTYHFPMNGADYVSDAKIFAKLQEAYARAVDLGLAGVVVHANRIRTFAEWNTMDLPTERSRVSDRLGAVVQRRDSSHTWLALENMPIIGNDGLDVDPTFCYSDDFTSLDSTVGVVWDICHGTSTVAYLDAARRGDINVSYILNMAEATYDQFVKLGDRVVHWHFAAFRGLNNPLRASEYSDGLLPGRGSLQERVYASLLEEICTQTPGVAINFEVSETDYYNRQNGPDIVKWAKSYLDTV